MSLYNFSVVFEINSIQLDARLDMPSNFLNEEPMLQVNIIHGLREQFKKMDLGELKLSPSYDAHANKAKLINEYGDLFPLKSNLRVEQDDKSKQYSIQLDHDSNMSLIPRFLHPILVTLVVTALTSAGTFIVGSSEGMLK